MDAKLTQAFKTNKIRKEKEQTVLKLIKSKINKLSGQDICNTKCEWTQKEVTGKETAGRAQHLLSKQGNTSGQNGQS